MNRRYLSEEDEDAILAHSAPALLTLLERRRSISLEKIYGEFMVGTADLRPVVATYVALVDLIRDIESRLQNRETKETP